MHYPSITTKIPDFDIFASIRSIMTPTITYTWKHVKGHQDNQNTKELDIWALLNIEADRIAKTRQNLVIHNVTNYSLPNENWTIHMDGYKLCKDTENTVYDFVSASTMNAFWHKKRGFTDQVFHSIDWTAIKEASQQITRTRQHWLAKHACGSCGVNSVLHKWKLRDDEVCPRCRQKETAQHVWICDSPDTRLIWSHALQDLTKWLISVDTDIALIQAIVNNLLPWSERAPQRTELEKHQDNIGWEIILEGALPIAWAKHQHQYYMTTGSKCSGKRWLTQLILKLWNTAWNLWEHRNNIAHAANVALEQDNINNELCSIMAANEYPPAAGYLFTDRMQETMPTAHLTTKKSWLQNYHAHVKHYNKQNTQDNGLQQMQQTMRTFLSKL
jgi:hypothetical protein